MPTITPTLTIPDAELSYVTSRSAGPGGQNVNKLESRVTLRFDVVGSPSLSEEERARVLAGLATRISREGILQVSSQRHRTQGANREAALERFVELMVLALTPEAERRPTKVPRGVRLRRLQNKRHRAAQKAERAGKPRSFSDE